MDLSFMQHRFLNTKVWGALEFIRIFNMTMPFASGFTGVVLASKGVNLSIESVSGMFIPVFLWAGGQVFNDIFDLDVDKINTPYRAVPSGRFSLRGSLAFGGVLTLAGITLSVFTRSFLCQILTLFAVVTSNLYSYKTKREGIWGHANFAFCVLLCIYIGESAVSKTISSFYAPLGVFLFHIAINIMASVGDVPGDKRTNVVTLPVQLGKIQATYAASLFWIGGIVWSIYFAALTVEWLAVILTVGFISVYNSQLLLRHPSPANATTTLRLFRLGTILLQLSLVVQYLSIVHISMFVTGIGVFTVSTFLLFEIPKGVSGPLKGVATNE